VSTCAGWTSRTAIIGLGSLAASLACRAHVPEVPSVSLDEAAEIRNLRIVPPPSLQNSTAEEQANKRVVLQWHYEFFDLGHFKEAAEKYMAVDFHQNDPDEQSGRAAYVAEFEHNGYVPRMAAERPPLIAVLAEGDLVMMVIPATRDPSGHYVEAGFIHCNMFRVHDGRIQAMWVSADAAKLQASTP
jgi:predicted SnoaL-like aldol condensation-catalyzing enzyme